MRLLCHRAVREQQVTAENIVRGTLTWLFKIFHSFFQLGIKVKNLREEILKKIAAEFYAHSSVKSIKFYLKGW